jgi:hypothetical protein
MSSGNRNRVNRFRPQLVGKLSKLLRREITQVGRVTNTVE